MFLTQAQKGSRMQWAKDHKDWGMEDWSRAVYSDAAYVVLGDSKGMVYVTWSPEEVYDNDCVVPNSNSPLSE